MSFTESGRPATAGWPAASPWSTPTRWLPTTSASQMPNQDLRFRTHHMTAEELTIRPLSYGDLPHVVALERRAFSTPWSPAMFVLELSKSSSICLGTFPGDGRRARSLVGYLFVSRYADVWHLMNIAVDPPLRRRGIASALLAELVGRIGAAEPITLEVRPSNAGAIALYERFGFRAAGLRPGYYRDTGEDAVIMWRTVENALAPEVRS
jgi:[ribosomal protein S18]-alanine N-acetyltransferase